MSTRPRTLAISALAGLGILLASAVAEASAAPDCPRGFEVEDSGGFNPEFGSNDDRNQDGRTCTMITPSGEVVVIDNQPVLLHRQPVRPL